MMKRLITVAFCMAAIGTTLAQTTTIKTKTKANPYKTGLGGDVRDARNRPFIGAQTFVYAKDSSAAIVSSGYTDSMGHYETNFTKPGKYDMRIVYPGARTLTISDVMVAKRGITEVNVRMNAPTADTSLPYTTFMPPAPAKTKMKIKVQ
jgi:hypothetical protein